MPGLCAILRPSAPGVVPDPAVGAMLRRMRHYPWLQTTQLSELDAGLALGVVHLDSTRQAPIARDARHVLVLDGELYDAEPERQRLKSSGVTFATADDAELLLRGWLAEGTAFLARVHGMFGALVWDGQTRELTILTDRFGLRPVYVADTSEAFLVASEIKALFVDPRVDRSWREPGLAQFFAFGHFFGDDTFHRGVRCIPPATVAVYRESGGLVERTYAPANRRASSSPEQPKLIAELDEALVAAVRRRAQAGERLGLSLSGGLDARTLLGLMPRGLDLQTVSIGIEGSIDHRGAAELAKRAGVPHHQYFLDQSFLGQFEHHLRSMIRLTDGHYLDQGIVMTTLPTYRQLGIEVLHRGHGGELLHMRKAYAFSLDDAALRASDAELEAWLFRHVSGYMLQGVPADLFVIDVPAQARASMHAALARTTTVDRPVDRVWQLFLRERLHRETALSMHKFGCFARIRMPYIDTGVVDTLLAMPAELKLDDRLQTAILRHCRPDFLGVVNSNTGAHVGASAAVNYLSRWRMRIAAKLGVRGYQPYERLGLWLRQELRPLVERVLLSEEFLARGICRPDAVKRVVSQHSEQQANHTFLIMSLLIFELGQRMLADPESFQIEAR